jgi:hypothetical protein
MTIALMQWRSVERQNDTMPGISVISGSVAYRRAYSTPTHIRSCYRNDLFYYAEIENLPVTTEAPCIQPNQKIGSAGVALIERSPPI